MLSRGDFVKSNLEDLVDERVDALGRDRFGQLEEQQDAYLHHRQRRDLLGWLLVLCGKQGACLILGVFSDLETSHSESTGEGDELACTPGLRRLLSKPGQQSRRFLRIVGRVTSSRSLRSQAIVQALRLSSPVRNIVSTERFPREWRAYRSTLYHASFQ